MDYLVFSYAGNSRELRKVINSLLRSGCALSVHKFNYVQRFQLKQNVVEKSELKYIMINTNDESKLLTFLSKNFPQMEMLTLK